MSLKKQLILFLRKFNDIVLKDRINSVSNIYLAQLQNYRFEILISIIACGHIVVVIVNSDISVFLALARVVTSLVIADLVDFGCRINEIFNLPLSISSPCCLKACINAIHQRDTMPQKQRHKGKDMESHISQGDDVMFESFVVNETSTSNFLEMI